MDLGLERTVAPADAVGLEVKEEGLVFSQHFGADDRMEVSEGVVGDWGRQEEEQTAEVVMIGVVATEIVVGGNGQESVDTVTGQRILLMSTLAEHLVSIVSLQMEILIGNVWNGRSMNCCEETSEVETRLVEWC